MAFKIGDTVEVVRRSSDNGEVMGRIGKIIASTGDTEDRPYIDFGDKKWFCDVVGLELVTPVTPEIYVGQLWLLEGYEVNNPVIIEGITTDGIVFYRWPNDKHFTTKVYLKDFLKHSIPIDKFKQQKGEKEMASINGELAKMFPSTVDAVLITDELAGRIDWTNPVTYVILKGKEKELLALAQGLKYKREEK